MHLIGRVIAAASIPALAVSMPALFFPSEAQASGCGGFSPTTGRVSAGCRKAPPVTRPRPESRPPSGTTPRQRSRSTGVTEPDPCTTPVFIGDKRALCFIPDPVPQEEAAPAITPEQAAQQALASLQLPEPSVTYTPSPRVNPWNKHFIGVPYRYVIGGVGAQSLTHTEQGITITMTASNPSITIDHGDGTTQQCSTTHACTHRYQNPGTYVTTVTAHWSITWSALGQSGTLTTTTTTSGAPTRYHEIHTLLTDPKQN